MNKNLEQAVKIVKNGGIIIFPTDTAFGIGCRVDNESAVQKLFKLRKRANDKAVPVLVSSVKMVEDYLQDLNPEVRQLMKRFWPGGLTIVFKYKKGKIPKLAAGGGLTIGVRMPNNKTTLDLIRKVGVPILGPSANFSGDPTPFKKSDLNSKLVSLVDFVLPGICKLKKASSVIDCTSKPFKILRDGAIDLTINKLTN